MRKKASFAGADRLACWPSPGLWPLCGFTVDGALMALDEVN